MSDEPIQHDDENKVVITMSADLANYLSYVCAAGVKSLLEDSENAATRFPDLDPDQVEAMAETLNDAAEFGANLFFQIEKMQEAVKNINEEIDDA